MSTIEWTGETLNPFTGCIRISPGCDNCYIETTPPFRMAHRRFNGDGPGSTTGVLLHPERLNIPRKRRKPETYFVNSLSDTFLAQIPVDYVTDVWRMMADTPRHTYQILTKRPERVARVLGKVHAELGLTEPLANVWLGTSIESDEFVRRADALRQAPAAVRFISAEPLLGPLPSLDVHGIDWIILGGESSKRKEDARPLELDWIRDVMGRCRAADVAVFVKQLGAVWARTNGASDKKGGKPEDWPEDLRVREYPTAA
jgi:protein gp37